MKRKPFKMLLSVALAASMFIASSVVAFADDATTTGTGTVETTVPVNGTINALTVSVTHPASVEYVINPNLGVGSAFVAPDIAITNNTVVPVNVTLKSLASAPGGTLQFTDVANDAKDWANLGLADTKAYIAMGIKIADDPAGWEVGYNTATRYAVDTGDTLFGALGTGATAHMTMVANHGYAFDQNYTAVHNLVLMFNLM